MNRLYIAIIFGIALSVLFVACGTVPTPKVPASTVSVDNLLMLTFTLAPTSTPLPTFTPTETPTPTLLPAPLQEIFPQVGNGVGFLFPENAPTLIDKNFVEAGDCI